MAAFVRAPEVESTGLRPLRMSAKQLASHHQDARTPPTVASDGTQGASLDHLLAHLESSKQALEHQVQQLLQENRLSKSAKKEQQWQMEGERLHSKLDSMNLSLMEKEERIRHLEKELRDARSSIQQVQRKCKEAENEKARVVLERANLQADLEDAQANFQNLEREYKLKHDVAEKQRRALESLSAKVEKQRLSFQDQLEDARSRLMESEEKEQKYEHAAQLANQQLAEKERQLKSLRDAHEKLLAVQKGRQAEERHEVKEVILVLEATQAKCEEQKVVIKELEQELVRLRKEAHQLDTRVAAAEADASSKASVLEKVQLELQNTTSRGMLVAKSKAQTDELKAQVETLTRALQDVENTLSEESALRFKAECALNECKVREKSFLKLEQDGKLLQAEVKWRNEQFESLEDAHNKLRDQFHEDLNMWASEKAALLKEIEILTKDVQSREIVIHDLLSQVKLTQQSLAHEENCRKLLEFQLADAKAGYDSMSAEYVAAQAILDNLRDNLKKEMAVFKDTRENHLKELHMQQVQIDRDQKELRQLEAEIDRYKSKCEQLQEAGSTKALETGVLGSERERLMKSLADAQATIAKKEVEMKELEMELDRSLTLSELLRTSLSEAEEKLLQGNSDAMKTLERVSESLSSKEQYALKLEAELERLHIESEWSIQALEDKLRNAHQELHSKSDSLIMEPYDERMPNIPDSVLQSQRLEEGVSSSESFMALPTRNSTEKDLEIEEKRYNVEQLLSQQRDVHSKELQMVTSQLTSLQAALNGAQEAQKLISVKEDEKRVLSLRLSEFESLVENGQSQISLLQADLQELRMSLEAETERVWHQVAARNEIETELDSWKSKVSELEDEISRLQAEVKDCKDVVEHKDAWELRVTSMQSQLEKTQVEVTDWKEVAKKSEFLNAELEKSMLAVKESLVDWEDTITSLADEGDIAKLQMESVLKQVHDEFQSLHTDLENTKGVITIIRREGHSLKAELLKETSLAGEEHLEAVVLDLTQELSVWKSKALTLQSQLQKWRKRAEEWESFNKVLEQAFVDFEHALHSLESDAGLSASTDLKLDIQESFLTLRKEVEEAKSELLELKEVAAKESQCAQSEFQESLNSLQAEVVLWKEKSAVATEESMQMKLQFEELLKNLHGELKSWKQFALQKNLIAETVAKEADELSVVNPINPFHQEDECCSSSHDSDEAASAQLDGLESNTSMSKEGRKLIRQFRASFKHLQSELESGKAAAHPKLVKRSTFVHKHEDTGLESLVRALQEEAVEIRAELADWKRSAQKTASVKEDLERTCRKLKAEVEGWKDRSAMAAGQRIVARRQLDDFAKQVKSLNGELQKWKDVATESNEAASKLQDDLERVQKESEDVKIELSEWMKKALELNCVMKDLEEKLKQNSSSRVHELEIEVEKWRSVATKLEEEGKVAKMELLDTLGKFEDELEVMSSNSISTTEGRSFKEEDQENSWQTPGRVEWRHDLEVSMQAEIEEWKTKHAEQEDSRQACEALIKELRMEVETFKCEDWKSKCAEQEVLRQACETLIKELRMEVETFKCEDWKNKCAEQEVLRQACETTIEELRMEVVSLKCDDWKKKYAEQKALKQACETIIKELRMDMESLNSVVEERKVELENKTKELESKTRELESTTKELGAELQMWKSRAEYAAEECRSVRAAYEDVIKKLAQWKEKSETDTKVCQSLRADLEKALVESAELQMWKSRAADDEEECKSLRDANDSAIKELAQWKEKSRTATQECHSMRAELEKALLDSAELQMWKSRAADAAEECTSLREAYDNAIKELAQWKEKSETATEECHSMRAELEKALLDSAELQMWKSRAADAAEECKSAHDAHDDLIKELAQWREKSETATEECQSMRAELEKVVHDLHDQVNLWKEKAEQALENVVKSQEYEDLIKALEEELCLWAQRTQESKLLQLQMENEQMFLKESLAATENELQRWKDHVSSNRPVQESFKSLTRILEEEEDEVNIDRLSDNEDDKEYKTIHAEEPHHWRARAEQAEHLQLHLEDMLAETQSELKTWKQKATDFSLAAEFLKEELECLIEEGSLDKEDLVRSNHELETQLETSKLALQKWEEKAATITQSTRFLMEEFDMTIEEGELEKQESYASINALKSSLLVWKEKVAEGESLQSELKATLLETETELQEWKEKATVAIATKSELSNRISELEAELKDWKTRAQEGVSVQLQLERALSQMVEEAAVSATDMQALKDELDRTVAESSDEIQELCNAINGLEAELTDVKDSQGTGRNSHLQQQLTETQARLQEWQDKATIAFQAEEELRQAVDEIRAETGKLDNFIRALKDELHEWREKAEHFEVLHHQVTASLASSQDELQRWKQKATKLELAAFEGESVHQTATSNIEEELESANELARKLTTHLDTQKRNEKSLRSLNRQLESDLVLAREEAFARKQKMTEILSQLEGSRDHQKELQKKLHLAQHRLHANQNLHSQTEIAAKENYTEFNNGRTEDILRTASLKNPAVDKMRQELSSLKSLVSKLGHVRGSDGEQSKSSSDDYAAEETNLRRTASLPSRPEAVIQKQVESSEMAQEGVLPQIMRRVSVEATPSKSRPHRFKVLADVNGKSPRAAVAKLTTDPSKHATSSRLLQ